MPSDPITSKYRKAPPAYSYKLDDCERPSCDDVKDMLKAAQQQQQTKEDNSTFPCPPRSAELGTSTWNFLHTMAAWYPDQPTTRDQTHMKSFFSSLARFYPCPWCAHDFQNNLERRPVETESREKLCQWLCEQHNVVNSKLGKHLFPCDMKTLDERWRKSSRDECQSKSAH